MRVEVLVLLSVKCDHWVCLRNGIEGGQIVAAHDEFHLGVLVVFVAERSRGDVLVLAQQLIFLLVSLAVYGS